MAISELGESLLARQGRQRQSVDDTIRKKRRQAEMLQAATLGVGIANNVLSNRAEQFARTEAMMAPRIQYRQAAANAAEINARQEAIQSSGKSAEDYFYDMDQPKFTARAADQLGLEIAGGEAVGGFKPLVDSELRELSRERAEQHRLAVEQARSLGSEEDFEAMMSLNSRTARPTSVGSWIARKFSDETPEQRETRAYNAIIESPEMENADRLNAFMSNYRSSQNLANAYDFASLVVPEPSDEEKFRRSRTTDIQGIGTRLVETITTTKVNRNTGEEFQDTEYVVRELGGKSAAELDTEATEFAIQQFDFVKDARDHLKVDAYSDFTDRVLNELNINPATITSYSDYMQVADLYAKEYANDPDKLNDAFSNDIYTAAMDVFLSQGTAIKALIADFDDDQETKDLKYAELTRHLGTLSSYAKDLANPNTVNFRDL